MDFLNYTEESSAPPVTTHWYTHDPWDGSVAGGGQGSCTGAQGNWAQRF